MKKRKEKYNWADMEVGDEFEPHAANNPFKKTNPHVYILTAKANERHKGKLFKGYNRQGRAWVKRLK